MPASGRVRFLIRSETTCASPTAAIPLSPAAEAELGEAAAAVDLDRPGGLDRLGAAEAAIRASTSPQLRAPALAASEIARRSWVCHSGLTGAGRIETRKL